MNKIRINTLLFLLCISMFSAYSQENIFHHTVERGQTVYAISIMYGISQEDIHRLNPGSKESIKAGSVLKIPQAKTKASPSTGIKEPDNEYTFHTIQSGETLYSLSVKYKVKADQILNANPGLSVATFRTDKNIRIPKQQAVEEFQSTPEVKVVTESIEYKIKKRETMYSLCKKFDVSSTELTDLNPILKKGVKAGQVIKIPVKSDKTVAVNSTVSKDLGNESDVNSLLNAPVKTERVNMIKVALLLPFMAEEQTNTSETLRFVEYYEGLLLAVDSLKNRGVSVKLSVYDTKEGTAETEKILRKSELKEANLIIGAVKNDQISQIANFAKENNIKYVIPFTSRNDDVLNNSSVYQVNTPHSYLYAKAAQSGCNLFANHNIIFLDTEDKEKEDFIKTFKHELSNRNIKYSEYQWKGGSAQNDIKALLSKDKANVLIPSSGSLETFNKIKEPLRVLVETMPGHKVSLFGYPEWQTYTRDCLEDFFALDTYIYTNFYANGLSEEFNNFNSKYRMWYSKNLVNTYPKYGILGFDTAMFFLEAINKYGANFESSLPKMHYAGLQTGFDFMRVNNWGGFINTKLFIVHYRKDFRIIREEAKL